MNERSSFLDFEHLIGSTGLLLMLLTARLSRHAAGPQHTLPERLTGIGARLAIDAIGLGGWALDVLTGRRRSGHACSSPSIVPPREPPTDAPAYW